MRIGVLGAGTAAIFANISILLNAKYFWDMRTQLSISCIHDPSIDTFQVGESLSPVNFSTLSDGLDLNFTEKLNLVDGTLRYYTKHFFDSEENNFSANYKGGPGAHVNSQTLTKHSLEILNKKYPEFHEIHDNVMTVEQNEMVVIVKGKKGDYEFDYIIDCRGSPTKEELSSELYETENLLESVNSVILYPDFKKYDEPYTSMHFHKNGWMFGVPLSHRKAFGYLYNNKITTETEAIKNFSEMKNIDASTLRRFSWSPYYRKKLMDGRIIYLGNKLYLFEPANAFPLFYYNTIVNNFIKNVIHLSVENLNHNMNNFHKEHINFIIDLIALTYCGDVHKTDSDFWNHLKPKAKAWLKQSYSWNEWIKQVKKDKQIKNFLYQGSSLMNEYINGFKIDINEY